MMEIWKTIPGYERYEISNLGRIRSWFAQYDKPRRSPRIIRPYNVRNYPRVHLYSNRGEKYQRLFVHRLVMLTFKPIINHQDMVVDHIDNDPQNSRLSNLRWATTKENVNYKKIHRTMAWGSRHPNTKFTDNDVLRIRKLCETIPYFEVAKMYKVSRRTIRCIAIRETWKHI